MVKSKTKKTWKDKINEWCKGIYLSYPKNIKKRFFYETSVCDKNMKKICHQKFIESDELEELNKSDHSSFDEYIDKSNNKYATSFFNLSGDTKLVIPMPCKTKLFTTIKDFIDNASKTQQKKFWIKVSEEIYNFLQDNEEVYISTHGLGVPYFHIRLCKIPKYYKTIDF